MATHHNHLHSHHTHEETDIHSPTRSPVPSRRIPRETASPVTTERVPLITINDENPPLARPETDDELDDREVVTTPYPGVDDGFFNGDGKPKEEEENPDSENIPTNGDDVPPVIVISPRAGGDGDSEKPDEVDGNRKPDLHPTYPGFPYAPGFGHDLEIGTSGAPDFESIPDVNVYQHKKTLAQGMMDLALFSANANQLRYVVESFNRHPYFWPSLVLLSCSLIFQVAVGIGLIWNALYNVKNDREICIANKINNFTVIGIFLVTVINVFISAFGVANAPTTT